MSGAAHRADDPDEVTRILQAAGRIAPEGDVQAMQVARPAEAEDERTTILVHDAPDEDERTTILPSPHAGPDRTDAVPDDVEGAIAPWSDVQAVQAAQPAETAEEQPTVSHDAHDGDERTTILQSPYAGPDRTRAATDDADGAIAPWNGVEAMQAARPPETAEEHPTIPVQDAPDEGERTTILQSQQAAPDSGDAARLPASWPEHAALNGQDQLVTRSDDPAGQEDRAPSTSGHLDDAPLWTLDPPPHPLHSDADTSAARPVFFFYD